MLASGLGLRAGGELRSPGAPPCRVSRVMLCVQILVAIYAHKRTLRLLDGFIILLLYPLSLLLVALLEGPGGLR